MKGKLKDLTRNMDGTWNLTITLGGDCRAAWDKYHDKDVSVEIKQYREKRSLDANAYAWTLIDKIAAEMHIDKVDVYREAIRSIGGNSIIVCVQDDALNSLRSEWQEKGLGCITETMPSKINGCTNVILYYGSSTYNTAQMSLLIDHLVQDAKALGIETMTPQELEALKIA
jgi:hypothetical protein